MHASEERQRGPERRRWAEYRPRLHAMIAGAVGVLLFPGPDLSWLAWVAFVPLLLILRRAAGRRDALARGWFAGFGFASGTLYWLTPNLVYFTPLAFAGVAVLWAPWGLIVYVSMRDRPSPKRAVLAVVMVPAGWVLIETVRSWKPFGGPWSLLGASQWDHPLELGLAALGGAWLVTFAIMASNTAIAMACARLYSAWRPDPDTVQQPARRAAALFAAGCAAVAALAAAAGPLWLLGNPEPAPSSVVKIALVQPNIIQNEGARFAAQIADTRRLAGSGVQLVVWGESSADYFAGNKSEIATVEATSARIGAPIMVNGRSGSPDTAEYNTSYLVDAAGIAAQYSKSRLVMFGEYIPLRTSLGWLDRITKAAGLSLTPGSGPVVMDSAGLRIGPLICFESAFPDMARSVARDGAQLLVYQSADSTFQGSTEPSQHASLAAVRAAETGRPAVQTALTGASGAFDARGRQLAWMSKDARGVVVVPIPLVQMDTPYDRYGNYVPVLAGIAVGGWAALWAFGALRRRGRADNGASGDAASGA